MNAGSLDRRIQFLRATLTDSGLDQAETWTNHGAPVWASYAPVRDAEKAAAGRTEATRMARFTVRWSAFTSAIDAKDQLTFEGRAWEIVGAKEVGRREWVELTAVSEAD